MKSQNVEILIKTLMMLIGRQEKTLEQAVALFQKTESRLKVQRHQYQHQSRLESVNVAVQQKTEDLLSVQETRACLEGLLVYNDLWLLW